MQENQNYDMPVKIRLPWKRQLAWAKACHIKWTFLTMSRKIAISHAFH